ncbi:MAG: chloride channel protein [Oscillospiraceae bacterium]|nr:chloride channel protein [Oscillospiraceae bacterium]
MKILEELHHPEKYFRIFFKWGLLGLLMGVLGGLLGAFFHHTLHFVTELRGEHTWLIFLLPLGGLLTVGLYRVFGMRNNRGTNEIIDAILNHEPVNPLVAPVIFIATAITHLFGGSAGREGAALQLGGSVASKLGKLLRLKEEEQTVFIMSGMSAVFAGLFGTSLTATLFTMEFASVGTIFSPALLPCYLAAFTAGSVSAGLGVHAETFMLEETVVFTASTNWRVLILALMIGVLGIAMCFLFHKAEHLMAKCFPNPWVRILAGAVVVMALTLMVGDHRYNGAGMDMALAAVEGNAKWYDFLLKLLFTAVTLSTGFKGGEIVPTFCIGATFGCALGGLLGLDPGIAAALGLVGLFCCVTNSPITALILSVEMFGSANLYLFAFVCVIAFVISGNWGLYASQIIQFSKARLVRKHLREPEDGQQRDV